MIRPICRDIILLSQKSAPAGPEDIPIADDLLDTLRANAERCVGMAANMIGRPVAIIVFREGETYTEMFNPQLVKAEGKFTAEEGCLSLDGQRTAARYRSIKVRWQTRAGQTRIKTFTGWTAQIIQHEMDHCAGIII